MDGIARLAVVILCAISIACLGEASQACGFVSRGDETDNAVGINATLDHVRTVLLGSGKGVRIYFPAPCNPSEISKTSFPQTIRFPRLLLEAPPEQPRGLEGLRRIFQKDLRVVVTQRGAEPAAIRIGKVKAAILRTRISSLRLTRQQQYNPPMAIEAIEASTDWAMALQRLHVRPIMRESDYPVIEPGAGLPHIPASIRHRTVDEILNLIAQTFGGIVIFGECEQQKVFDIDYTDVGN